MKLGVRSVGLGRRRRPDRTRRARGRPKREPRAVGVEAPAVAGRLPRRRRRPHVRGLRHRAVRCWGYGANGRLGYGNLEHIGDNEAPGSVGAGRPRRGPAALAIAVGGDAHLRAARHPAGALLGPRRERAARLRERERHRRQRDARTRRRRSTWARAGPRSPSRPASAHTCALLDTGQVRCWGNGGSGRLGYGNTNSIGDNETPGGSARSTSAAAGRRSRSAPADAHTCAILDTGQVRCWGQARTGASATATSTTSATTRRPAASARSTSGPAAPRSRSAPAARTPARSSTTGRCAAGGPARTGGSATATRHRSATTRRRAASARSTSAQAAPRSRSAPAPHTPARSSTPARFAAGAHGADGRLGYGNLNDIGDNETPGSVAPVDLGVGRTALAIAAGAAHTCALLDDGQRALLGLGVNGQLGYANANSIGDNETPGSVEPGQRGRAGARPRCGRRSRSR